MQCGLSAIAELLVKTAVAQKLCGGFCWNLQRLHRQDEIKAAKRIFNSDKICLSYSDLNFGVTFWNTVYLVYTDSALTTCDDTVANCHCVELHQFEYTNTGRRFVKIAYCARAGIGCIFVVKGFEAGAKWRWQLGFKLQMRRNNILLPPFLVYVFRSHGSSMVADMLLYYT